MPPFWCRSKKWRRLQQAAKPSLKELLLTDHARGELNIPERGRKRRREDAMIGATAVVHDLTVVTRNIRDFHRLGIRTFNPFDG